MARPRIPGKAGLVMGVLWSDDEALRAAQDRVERSFGTVTRVSKTLLFREFSDHYEPEMGPGLSRVFWHIRDRVPRGALVEIKLATNRIEEITAAPGGRRVNLDPGLLSAESLVLATTKGYAHRIYLSKGIYGELALLYRKGRGYEPLPWTYRDYRESWVREFFGEVRKTLMEERTPHV